MERERKTERRQMRTWAEIDLDHLTHNVATLRRHVGAGTKLMGVVKADAYGHGAVRVAKHLQSIGMDYIAVSSLDECEELRVNGVTLPILMLGYTPAHETERLLRLDMTAAIQDLETARALSDRAGELGQRLRVHIKLDTGMGRLGFLCDEAHFSRSLAEILALTRLPGLDVEGIFTHFCVSDEEGEESAAYTRLQHERFRRMVAAVEAEGVPFRIKHCCNAGAIASYPEFIGEGELVRCGILLYGAGELAQRMGMRAVMRVKSTVCSVKHFDAGAPISYGRTYLTARPSRIGVLPIGYADGFSRALSNRYAVVTAEGAAPIAGRICMDMTMIDLTDCPGVDVGDTVEIYGEQNPIGDAARLCGTISYELLCAVSKRVPRYYIRGGEVVDYNLQLLY